MTNTICLDERYSTIRLLTQKKPEIVNNPEDKFQTVLYYSLASGYFVENFRKDLIKKQNVILWNLLRVYKNSSRKFNLNKISDFYIINSIFNLDYLFLIKKAVKKIWR